ncbi:MAG: DUF6526 family protein [Agriterribacter sp.]
MQQYSNHVRYYVPHHFIFYPVITALLFITIRQAVNNTAERCIWIVISALIVIIGWLSFMLRQHYSLMVQNRIVRLEMRLRYYQLTNQRFEPIEQRLSFGQLAALRFASDEELEPLLQRTLTEGLTPDAIKKSIKNWVPDMMRV